MRIGIGLVIKGNEQFVDKWLECASKIGDWIFVVDNGLSNECRMKLINHKAVKRYHIQKGLERNMSRDYQIILEDARKENCQWILNLDSDEYIPEISMEEFIFFLINCEKESIGFPMFEMRGDKEHFVMVKDPGKKLKDGRLVHKCYKVLSHLEFDERDKHGQAIPHNCNRDKTFIPIPIQHYGHMTKKLRDEKRKKVGEWKDEEEEKQTWMEENPEKITIKSWSEFINKKLKEKNEI